MGQDITEGKKSQAQVIHASKLATLGEMATSVAHEINQPLNVIRLAAGNTRMRLQDVKANRDDIELKLKRIEEQTARAASIIDHMRMFGRKVSEKETIIDLHKVVLSSLDLVGEQLRLSGIKVHVEVAQEEKYLVLGHGIQMEQVFLNLLTNARDAISFNSPEDRGIYIGISKKENFVRVSVSDVAGGVPIDVVDRIFEPFFTTKEIGSGTGLGLSVSYGIINDMGGKIEVENTNGGACFSISIPMHEVAEDQ